MADTILTIGGDTSLLERQIQEALSKNFKLTGLDAKSFSQPLGKIKGQLGEFEKSLEASNARVVAFGASAGAIYYLQDALKGLVNSTIQVEKTLADINTVLDASESGIKSFGNELFNVANKTSQAFETAAGAALEFSRQGLGLEETLKRTSDALTLAKISGLSAADSVEALTAAVNSFSDSGLTAAQIVNKLAAVDARYAVSSADLAEAIKRVGSSASEAGISIDQLIGLVTSAQQTTARGGAVIGNSFKTIFTRLQRPKVLESLQEIGIQTQSVTGETLPLIQVLTQLAAKFDTLSSAQKSQVAELVGGVYQINILKAVIGDLSKEYSTYSGALKASAGASNEAERRVASLTQTLDSQINRVTNNLKRAGSVIGELTIAPALEKVLSGANAVLESFALGKEPQSFGEKAATGFLKGLGTFLSGPGLLLGAAAVFQIFKRLASFVGDAGRTILGLGQAAQQQAQIQAQILQILQKNPAVYNQIASGAISVESAAAGYLKIVQATNAELERQKILSGQIAASVLSGGGGMMGGGGGRRKTKATGFIPNFAMSGPMAEMDGASKHKGGYQAGMPYITTIHDGKGSSFKSWVNSAETVKTFTNASGYKATVVRPPNGFGPGTEVAAAGFIPNFAKKLNVKGVDAGARGKEFEKLINYYLINERTTAGTALLDFPYPTNSLTTASPANKAKIALNPLSVYGDAKIKSATYSRKDLIKKLVGSLDRDQYKRLLKQAEYGKSEKINLNRYLPAGILPSLISSKSSVTPDNTNAVMSAELGGDVILNLARLFNRPESEELTEVGFHKDLLLNYIEDYVTLPNFNSGFIPNFAAGDGSISLGQYAAKKGKLVSSLKAAGLNAAYQAGVSADEIRTIDPKWQFKGATGQEQARRAVSAQQKLETFKKEFAYNNKPIKEIVVPWNKTISDFGGDPSRFGDAYEDYATAFLRGKYGKRYKTAVELGLPGTRTKEGGLVGRNFARVEGAIFDKNLQEVMMWIELKALSEQNKLSYRRADVADKFANIGYGGKVAKGARGLVLRSRAAGFVPNFAPVTGGNFYDFDETISVYPHDINPKELFFPESVKKAKLSPLGRSLQGSQTPINVLTARGNNSKKAITQFLIDNNIPVNKVITSAGMFKNIKVPGKRKAERGLTSAEKKATFLSRLFAKTGVPSRLIDDAPANISAIQALKNPNISAELYSTEGQKGLGQQFKFGGFIPNFAKSGKSSSNLSVFRGVNPKFGDTNKGVNSIGIQHKLVAVLGRGNFSENPAIAKSYGSKLLTRNVDESKLLNLQSYNDIMGLYQKHVPEYASRIKNSQGAEQLAIITEAGKVLSKKLKAQGYSGIRSPLGGGDKKYLNEEKGLPGNLIIPLSSGFIPNFAKIKTFNPDSWTKKGGFIGRSNNPTAEGIVNLLNHIGIPFKEDKLTKAALSETFRSKENKLKLYNFLRKDPILVKEYPDLYNEVSDGNHRYELAKLAGIKNIPVLAKGFIPNFAKIDRRLLRDIVRLNNLNVSPEILTQNQKTQFSKFGRYGDVNVFRGVEGMSDRWRKLAEEYGLDHIFDNTKRGINAVKSELPLDRVREMVFSSRKAKIGSAVGLGKRINNQKDISNLDDLQKSNFLKNKDLKFILKKYQEFLIQSQTNAVSSNFTPFVSSSYSPDVPRWFGKLVSDKKISVSRIFNKKTLEELTKKYGPEKVKEAVLGLSKWGGGRGVGFDMNSILNNEPFMKEKEIALLSSGFIPNFNVLNEAIGREMAAGFSASQVKVGQSNSLKTSFNPQGLGVYNTVQEPGGLSQGMGFARKAGVNPKTKGMSSGFIPNFAPQFNPQNVLSRGIGNLTQNKDLIDKINANLQKIATDTSLGFGDIKKLKAETQQYAQQLAKNTKQNQAVFATNSLLNTATSQAVKARKKSYPSVRRPGGAGGPGGAGPGGVGPGGMSIPGDGGLGGGGPGGLMKGFLLNQLISTGAQFLPEEYQGIAEKAGGAISSYYTIKELGSTFGDLGSKFKGVGQPKPGSSLPPGFKPKGGMLGRAGGALGRAGGTLGRAGGMALGGLARLAGPAAIALSTVQAGGAALDYFGAGQGGIGGTQKEDQDRKDVEKELNKYKTESGKTLAAYNQMSRSKTGAFGEATGEKARSSMKDVPFWQKAILAPGAAIGTGLEKMGINYEKILGFDFDENLKRFNFGDQRKAAAGAISEQAGGIGNIKKILERTGGGKTKEDVNKFTEEVFKSLQAAGKETGGLQYDQKQFEALSKRNMQAEAGVAGVAALNEEEKKLLETYKAAKDAAGQLIKDVKQMEKVKALQATFKDVASAMASSGAKATAMLQIYKQVQEKEKQRGEALKKNYGGGVEAFMNPEKSMGSMDKIQQALKTLNDPRLAGNAVERGRAAARYMEGATELGINLPKGAQGQLSGLVETGLTTFNERNLNTIGAIGGQFRNNFGIQTGITQSRMAMGALAKESGLTTSQRQLTQNDAMAGIGYRNPMEMQAMGMTDKQVQALEKTQQAVSESIAKLSSLAEAAAKGQISPEQFNEAAAALKRAAETNQTNSKDMAAQLEAVFNTLPDKLKGIAETSATKIQTETSVTGGVKLELSEDAQRLLRNANEIIELNKNDKKDEKNNSGTRIPTKS